MFPEVEEGKYEITLRTDEGNSASVNVQLKMSLQNNEYITLHGGPIKITGIGLPQKWPHPLFSINRKWSVIETTATYMIINVPPSR